MFLPRPRFALLPFVLFAAGCGGHASDDSGTDEGHAVIADDDRVKVDDEGTNVPEKYRKLLDAFGVLYYQGGFCTATHLGGGVVMTAGHCFGAGDEPKKDYVPEGGSVRWGVRGSQHATWPTLSSDVVKVLEAKRSLPGADYAFFVVNPIPQVRVEVELEKKAKNGQSITLFSHPWGRPLEWSRVCKVLPPGDYGGPLRFQHKCDTEGGSSGGAILDDATLKIVGIHDSDNGVNDENGNVVHAPTENQATYVTETPIKQYLPQPEAQH